MHECRIPACDRRFDGRLALVARDEVTVRPATVSGPEVTDASSVHDGSAGGPSCLAFFPFLQTDRSLMPDPQDTPEVFGDVACRCGYLRAGSDHRRPCPECGTFEIREGGGFAESQLAWRGGRFAESQLACAWRDSRSRVAKAGLIIALITFLLGLANSILAVYLAVWLSSPGFKGGTAGMALLYPPLIWVFLQVPFTVVALVTLVVPGPSTEAVAIIKRFGFCLSGIGFFGPVVIFAIAIGVLVL